MKTPHRFPAAPFALAVAAVCAAAHPAAAQDHGSAPRYGYEGDEGPAHWGALSPAWAVCGIGRAQSPVKLERAAAAQAPPLRFGYQAGPLELRNNGHTVMVPIGGRGSLTVGTDHYTLQQYHFHTPAEHEVNGRRPAMELHLVHLAADLSVAAVGVLIEPGDHNPALEPLAANLPTAPGQVRRVPGSFDPASLLPAGWQRGLQSFRYTGSLTTPPCGEGVHWFVLRAPVQASEDQIARFRRVMHHNSRPLQPLYGRVPTVDPE
ncbi:MAG TPA: carbonic anhydrase family protein [Longimicrobium sp.]|nr:carbonic anhydrase family protein [Longimicrobium sp.]